MVEVSMDYTVEGLVRKHLNKKIAGLSLNVSKDEVEISFQDGTSARFTTEGDCCSRSWIEHLEAPKDFVGAILLGVQDGGVAEPPDYEPHEDDECVKFYETRFHTDKGDIILEYRNSSNGYYGGSLVVLS
jgi:hypothetical protein